MNELFATLTALTGSDFRARRHADKSRIVNDFAESLGWRPSDYLEARYALEDKSNGHLIVEHGLEYAAVITFLCPPSSGADISTHEVRSLLELSYNNLVDWHLVLDRSCVSVYYTRSDPPMPTRRPIEPDDLAALSRESFEGGKPSRSARNLPALDTVLIETIDFWKRFLYDEIRCRRKNDAISALMNAIMFVRAVEDHHRLKAGEPSTTLLARWQQWQEGGSNGKTVADVLRQSLRAHRAGRGASSLVRFDLLRPFERVRPETIENLIKDFYRVKQTPYSYNFALMSRHALSRIYEKYVALMRQDETATQQRTLFPIDLPEAERNKAAGAIYTPQYIARFICRFIESQVPPAAFRGMTVADPACGSGVFLRAFLERQTRSDDLTTAQIGRSFGRVLGLDIDENACQASRLSLALLHLMLTQRLPRRVEVITSEAITYYQGNPAIHEAFGAVVGNPPFVRLELQASPSLRRRVRSFLSDICKGRHDLYLGILRAAMGMVKPGGYLGVVLPHSFLVGEAPAGLRNELREQFWLRCVVDLSAIRVFEDFSAYVILLIAQRKPRAPGAPPSCKIVRCQEFVGWALQDALDNKTARNPYYSVFDVDQEYFGRAPWVILGPEHVALERRLQALPRLQEFLVVREGVITGCDDVYIRPSRDIPRHERHLYVPFLHDRKIERYTVPRTSDQCVYYPYDQGERIPEAGIAEATETWSYLVEHRAQLPKTAAKAWPYLERHRGSELLRPKIIGPHLVLVPRFALDAKGRYAISRAPFFITKGEEDDLDLLRFFTGVLNSSVVHWYLGAHAYRFSRGYVMLDPKYLRTVPVPDPSRVAPDLLNRLVSLVQERIDQGDARLEDEIDRLVIEAYGLGAADLALLGAAGG